MLKDRKSDVNSCVVRKINITNWIIQILQKDIVYKRFIMIRRNIDAKQTPQSFTKTTATLSPLLNATKRQLLLSYNTCYTLCAMERRKVIGHCWCSVMLSCSYLYRWLLSHARFRDIRDFFEYSHFLATHVFSLSLSSIRVFLRVMLSDTTVGA